ncbi:MAG: ABC transporter substrate-binding protein [Enterobacteriaceae bacterium]
MTESSGIRRWSVGWLLGLCLAASSVQAEKVTDIAGRTVEVPAKVERILLGEGRLFYAVALLEGKEPLKRIVGWQGDMRKLDQQSYDLYRAKFPQMDSIPLIGNTTADSTSAEQALKLNPDVALFSLSGHGPGLNSELVTQLEKAGIPVVFVDFRLEPMKNTLPSMQLLGKVLHREEVADKFAAFYQKEVDKVKRVVDAVPLDKRPSVFIELKAGINEECCRTAGNGNMGDFIDFAGGKNIAKNLLPGALGAINLEQVLAVQPDIYIASGNVDIDAKGPGVKFGVKVSEELARQTLHSVLQRKGISSLNAVQQGKAYGIWHSFYNSPYNLLAIQAVAKWINPEALHDLDPQQTMRELYQQFLVVEPKGTYWISDKQE